MQKQMGTVANVYNKLQNYVKETTVKPLILILSVLLVVISIVVYNINPYLIQSFVGNQLSIISRNYGWFLI